MKKSFLFISLIFLILIFLQTIFMPSVLTAQAGSGFRGQSINGATGLFTVPSGRIGWSESGNAGLDFGYRAVINYDAGVSHIPAVTLSLFRFIELSAAFDTQPVVDTHKNNDLLLGIKFGIPAGGTSIALGANVQLLNLGGTYNYYAYQPYAAITFAGSFFSMNAETTIVLGKTLYSGGPEIDSNIDFGMGFDVLLFPDVFDQFVHLIIDFANFSYNDNSWPNNAHRHTPTVWRGILNAGLRIDLSAIKILNKYKFLIDMVFNDLFDAGSRSFTAGAVFGLNL